MKEHTQDVLLGQILGECAAESVPDDLDLWPAIRSEAQNLGVRRRKRMLYRRVALLAVSLAVLLPFLTLLRWPSGDNASFPSEAVAEAYENLRAVRSVHVVIETFMDRLVVVTEVRPPFAEEPTAEEIRDPDAARQRSLRRQKRIQEETVKANCIEKGTTVSCDLVDKGTGEEVGSVWSSGGRRITEGDFVPPDQFYYVVTNFFDDEIPQRYYRVTETMEGLRVGDKFYTRQVGKWTWNQVGNCCSSELQWFWGLFEEPLEGGTTLGDTFDSVERLPDTEIDGIPAEHYRVEKMYPGDYVEMLEVWIDKDSRYPLKLFREQDIGTDSEKRWTYRFSNFNEPVEIPTVGR